MRNDDSIQRVTVWPREADGVPGYAVKYQDGSSCWIPKEAAEGAELPTNGLTFEFEYAALAMRQNKRVTRSSWPQDVCMRLQRQPTAEGVAHFIATPRDPDVPAASLPIFGETDLHANDWLVVEEI